MRLHGQQVGAFERDRAAGDLVAGAPAQRIASVDLPAPFGPMIA
jgi:hypothetical protein